MASWETVIGLEVHVQLRTASKMFCACSTAFGDPPNTNVCPTCLGLPGALPVPNGLAVGLAVRMALALDCTVHMLSLFARKNYFYPDLPKGYQISQYEQPLATSGCLAFDSPDRGPVRATIVRLHLEEDAGKSLHDRYAGATAVDHNRCGVPLIEIVSGPDFRSPAEARAYLAALKQLVEYLAVSDANMEEGSLRVDANISIRPVGEPALSTRTEVKNMNSFSNVERALEAERARQIAVREAGGEVVQQTMLYDPSDGTVRPMRAKEESHDYRYFPDPDLPPLVLSSALVERERSCIPELPRVRRDRFVAALQLSDYDAGVLTATRPVADYFEAVVAAGAEPKSAANWVMREVLADAKQHGGEFRVPSRSVAQLIALAADGVVSHHAAKRVFGALAEHGGEPAAVAERLGLIQVSDVSAIAGWVDAVLASHADEVRRYRGGEAKLLGFFTGRVMRLSKGQADPQAVQALLRARLSQ